MIYQDLLLHLFNFFNSMIPEKKFTLSVELFSYLRLTGKIRKLSD